MKSNYFIAIMAGGVGSRFWPASREMRPKQFLDIIGTGQTLIQSTFDRAAKIVPKENILVVSNHLYKDLILQQLPDITSGQILLEPSRNNTAPCVAYTALHLKAKNSDAVFAMLPSDHVIMKEGQFISDLHKAFGYAERNPAIVTLGIQPTRPDTGYGYIKYINDDSDVKPVKEFKEKPDKETAQTYIEQGGFVWNAGIFVWAADTILESFGRSAGDITEVLSADMTKYNTPQEQEYINEVYPQTRSISVDFAILEHAKNVYTIPTDIGWSDLGTWNSLYDFSDKDDQSNASASRHVHLEEASHNMVRSHNANKLIVIKGLKDYIVIDEEDVLLIYPREEEQAIKQLRGSFKETPFV